MISQALIYTIIAYIGSCIAGIMLIPQVYLTIKTKKTDDISLEFLILNMLAVLAMIPYSIYFKLHPILIANLSHLVSVKDHISNRLLTTLRHRRLVLCHKFVYYAPRRLV